MAFLQTQFFGRDLVRTLTALVNAPNEHGAASVAS
jgi:hypothetical protein